MLWLPLEKVGLLFIFWTSGHTAWDSVQAKLSILNVKAKYFISRNFIPTLTIKLYFYDRSRNVEN